MGIQYPSADISRSLIIFLSEHPIPNQNLVVRQGEPHVEFKPIQFSDRPGLDTITKYMFRIVLYFLVKACLSLWNEIGG